MASTLTTQAILEAIENKLIRLCPRGGWPPYGGMTIDLVFHDDQIVDSPEVSVKDKTKLSKNNNDAES